MQRFSRSSLASLVGCLSVGAALAFAAPAFAQDASPAALPTAPGADKATSGGPSEAPASLPGAPGLSPLEPYLITWLLPVSGALCAFIGYTVDKRVRLRRGRL